MKKKLLIIILCGCVFILQACVATAPVKIAGKGVKTGAKTATKAAGVLVP